MNHTSKNVSNIWDFGVSDPKISVFLHKIVEMWQNVGEELANVAGIMCGEWGTITCHDALNCSPNLLTLDSTLFQLCLSLRVCAQ